MKRWIMILLSTLLVFSLVGCGQTEPEEVESLVAEQGQSEELGRTGEIEKAIRGRIDDGDYKNAKLDRITINENLGTDTNDYIVLVYFNFEVRNRIETGNEVMRTYSDDLAATLANKGITDVAEIAVFWEDEYNNRNVKHAYEYKNGAFYISDIAGE